MNTVSPVKIRLPEAFPPVDFSVPDNLPPASFQEGEAFGLGNPANATDRFASVNALLQTPKPFTVPDTPRIDVPKAPVAAAFDTKGIVAEAKKQEEKQQVSLFREAAKIAVRQSVIMQAIQIEDFKRLQASLAESSDDESDDDPSHNDGKQKRRRYELAA